jgi:LuxR family maltose regulon positive regulatory protein
MDASAGIPILLATFIQGAAKAAAAGKVIEDARDVLVTGVVVFVASSMGFAIVSLVVMPLLSRFGNNVSHRRHYAVPVQPLLTTKLRQPRARIDTVPRLRLLERMTRGLAYRLVLLSAPAGSGKTTLLTQWMRHTALPTAYVAVDSGDNTPARFLSYLIGALQTLDHRLGGAALVLLRTSPAPPTRNGIEASLSILLNDVSAYPGDFVLILDNYHLIHNPAVHEAVSFLIEHAPPQMRWVIASRTEPPLSLARLRASGQLTELRDPDLRFTPEETATFLKQTGIVLNDAQLAALQNRTEGWIAALQLASLSMCGYEDAVGIAATFTGSHPYVASYLAEEAFQSQSEALQTFLLHTSILSRLCGPLCEAVTGQPNGKATLEALHQANLFVTPLDSARLWYRFHPLFVEFLQERLQRTQPHQIARLHSCAARWYEKEGRLADAIDHALAAADFPWARRLIEQVSPSLLACGESARVQCWLDALSTHGEMVNVRAAVLARQGTAPAIIAVQDCVEPLAQPLVEPLSERELEVLQLIMLGMSNQEIAQALTVTLNTIKTHVRSIYGKLNARSRVQAVTRARQLRVLQ